MHRGTIDMPSRRTVSVVGQGAISDLAAMVADATSVVMVTDTQVAELYGSRFRQAAEPAGPILEWSVPPGEASKSLWQAECLYDYLASKQVDRRGVMVAFGGGVVGDLAGFVASTWLRGLRWINCPTTLLAAVDASVGGKTAIDHAGRKNCVGTFHQPDAILVETPTLQTLTDRAFRSGLAESVKHALITGEDFLQWHETHAHAILQRDLAMLEHLIVRNVEIKAHIVQQDERDLTGQRAKLNLGHTVGHALEMVYESALTHGECVALGTLAAFYIAEARGLVSAEMCDRLGRIMDLFQLPTRCQQGPQLEQLIPLIQSDKKTVAAEARFVLPTGIGQVVTDQVVQPEEIERALQRLSESQV